MHAKYYSNDEPLKIVSKFSLIDLAGSERLLNEKNSERLEEAKFINKSLSALGNVAAALRSQGTNVQERQKSFYSEAKNDIKSQFGRTRTSFKEGR